MSVVIETSIGDLVIDLYTDERPNCCKNFLKLCKIKYYNFCLFHSIQKDFIAQTGDPKGTGRGGDSIFSFVYGDQARYFEMERFPKIKHRKLGAVSMINNGEDMHGSQFLITLSENIDYLDNKHTVFGEVAKGFDVLDTLNNWLCDSDGRPYQDIRIMHTVVLDDPFDDFPALRKLNDRASPEPTDERLKSDRIRIDEDVDQLEGLSPEEIDEFMREREAKTRAKLLEIIGDIPDAEIKPPENVLFVCKLNPVTNDDDLELIFSRFGKINSCEVIRDRKSGDSLCYAFIEFDRQEDCENAFFKMGNALIDDRRIHVDFSQSVAKYNWKGKGTGTGYIGDVGNYNKSVKKEYRPRKDDYPKRSYGSENDHERRKYEERKAPREKSRDRHETRHKSDRDKESRRKYDHDRHHYKEDDRSHKEKDRHDDYRHKKKH